MNVFEVPKMIQKVLQYVQESKLTIWEEFKPPKKLTIYKKHKENTQKHLHVLERPIQLAPPHTPGTVEVFGLVSQLSWIR